MLDRCKAGRLYTIPGPESSKDTDISSSSDDEKEGEVPVKAKLVSLTVNTKRINSRVKWKEDSFFTSDPDTTDVIDFVYPPHHPWSLTTGPESVLAYSQFPSQFVWSGRPD